eukprot:CAMPEP_0197935076 /NCGR_PEP_ID=MMETSP1439-20131203/112756_1 /TAXON_ID=66791 /ORGANISM="Gonyaulax spinifera, Strain CCMP409" /LENGTH=42 /DNA_ID= /DNA_START= /DNA_END= /DNA_ORIENTATION=
MTCRVDASRRTRASVTPIQKVLTLMSDMLKEGKKEKEFEANK